MQPIHNTVTFLGFPLIALGLVAVNSWQQNLGIEVLPIRQSLCVENCSELNDETTLVTQLNVVRESGENMCALPAEWAKTYENNDSLKTSLAIATRELPIEATLSSQALDVAYRAPSRSWFGALPSADQLSRQVCIAPVLKDPQLWMAYLALAWLVVNLGYRRLTRSQEEAQ